MKYKRTPYKFYEKARLLFPIAAKTFGILAGICATIFAFIDIAGGVLNSSLVMWVCLVISLTSVAFSFLYSRKAHLPDIVIFDDEKDDKYTVRYADENSERMMNSFTSIYFGEFYIEDDEVELWRKINPNGFLMLYNQHNQPCGDITILGIEEKFMDLLIKGEISDAELTSDKIMSFEDTRKNSCIYITGIIVLDPITTLGRKRALALIWATVQYLKKYFISNPPKKIYAVAITKESENLLPKLGFQVEGIKNRRVDNHTLYSLTISKESLHRVISRIGDYSSLCKVQI